MLILRRLVHRVPLLRQRSFATKSTQNPHSALSTGEPLISCRQKKFNLFKDGKQRTSAKFGTLELASNGWMHHKSKGDFFTIHPSVWLIDTLAQMVPMEPKLFANLGLDERIQRNLLKNFNVKECSYAQYEGIPLILAGDHTLIAAETGSGKTLSYLVPVVQQILERKEGRVKKDTTDLNTPIGLVLTPGRELGRV